MSGEEYRVEFSITRRCDGEDDFTEIGFWSSGAWASVEAAADDAYAAIQNGLYESVSVPLPDHKEKP